MANNQTEELTEDDPLSAENTNSDMEDQDIDINLFESVWVKLEVIENQEVQIENNEDADTILTEPTIKRKKCKRWVPTQKHLKCDHCEYRTGYKQSLAVHVLTHTDEKPHACSECDFKTKYTTALKNHMHIKHGGNDILHKCDVCDYTTNYKYNLSLHKRKHDLTKQFKCPECNYATAYKHNAMKHSRKHSNKGESSYNCEKCPYVTKYEGNIIKHMAKVHFEISEKAKQCQHCSFTTKTGCKLNIHKKRSEQIEPIKCVHCDFQTLYRCALREHKLTHLEGSQHSLDSLFTNYTQDHEMTMNEIQSKIENEAGTSENENSKIHNELKNKFDNETYYTFNENSFNNQYFPNVSQLTEHERNNQYVLDPSCDVACNKIQVMESFDLDRPFQCTTCSYNSRFKASVQRHFLRHHTIQNRPYKCMNCDFSTKTKDHIALHNKRSKSDEILTCKICSFTSVFKCQFTMHEKVHYPFKCVICEYSCRAKANMQKHFMIVHLGLGLKCRYCDFRATRKESLLGHEVIHTGKKPFQCQLCEYSSVRRMLLENHMNRFHKDLDFQEASNQGTIEPLQSHDQESL